MDHYARRRLLAGRVQGPRDRTERLYCRSPSRLTCTAGGRQHGCLPWRQIRLIWANRLRRPGPAVWDPEAAGKESPDGVAAGWWPRRVREEATVEEFFVWMTTRQLKPGTLAEFERAWRPDTHPEGMLRAYAYWSADEREIVGVSFWASQQLCEAWRSSGSEARRREAMAGYVLGEQERFYRGRELHVPDH